MNVLLFINGVEGSEASIEDGFKNIQEKGIISNLEWFYFQDYSKKHSVELARERMINTAVKFQPDVVVIFHVGSFPLEIEDIRTLKRIKSQPLIVYDEGDIYGGIAKPIPKNLETVIKNVNLVSIRGLGEWFDRIKKLNPNVMYTPHSASLINYTKELEIKKKRAKNILFIGNSIKSKLGNFRRLPGAREREVFVRHMTKLFPGSLAVYGAGWEGLTSSKGPLPFNDQPAVCNDTWFHISYEHYPKVSYYFSDRLPISLASGQIYICHYHEGYEQIFKDCGFIYYFKTNEEAVDIMNYLFSLSQEELVKKSEKAIQFALENYHPNVIWMNFFNNVLHHIKMKL